MRSNVMIEHNLLMRKTIGASSVLAVVANEDDSSFISKVTSFFIDKVSSLCNVFQRNEQRLDSKYDTLKQRNVYTEELLKLRKDVIVITNEYEFGDIKYLNVPTIVGLKGDLLSAVVTLEKGFELINSQLFERIEELDIFLSKLISIEDSRVTTRETKPNTDLINLNKQLDKILKDNFDSKLAVDVVKLEKLLPNVNSLKTVFERTISLESYTTSKAILELQNSVSSITEKINILISSLQDKEDKYEISKAMLKKVTGDIEEAARLVTNTTSYLHIYNQLQFVVKSIILEIKGPGSPQE